MAVEPTWMVRLLRGPKPTKEFNREPLSRAMQRVYALMDLHNLRKFSTDKSERTLTLDAGEWYQEKSK